MTFRLALLFCALALVAACKKAPQTKEAVRQGVVEHLRKNSGLELGSMDIDVASVNFKDKQATAMVSFRPKNSPDAGMSMSYTLDAEGNKWVVKKKEGSAAHSEGMTPQTGALPPGHLPATGQSPDASKLPPGHPSVGGAQPHARSDKEQGEKK